MFILLAVLNFVPDTASLDGFYSYQVAEVNSDLDLYCLSSGEDIRWFRKRDDQESKEELKTPGYQISKSYRCGNPHLCGGYDTYDTKVCLRSTLRLKDLQKTDRGTYFCQEGLKQGMYSYAYVINILDRMNTPHIYDFTPLECNQTVWYGCVTTRNVNRYEYFLNVRGDKTALVGTKNSTNIGGYRVEFQVRDNYVTLRDYDVLESPQVKFGCRAYGHDGSFSEYETGKAANNPERPKKTESYETYLLKVISIGVGALVLLIIAGVVTCKLNTCRKKRCQVPTEVRYTEINQGTQNLYSEPKDHNGNR